MPVNPLIGRGAEVAAALRELARPEVRLLTLLGPGGAGKTRLAIDLAAEAARRYRDGVWLVLLAPLLDPGLMVSEIARVLEVDVVPGEPLEQALSTALADRELLLVLDNFEHLLDGAALVSDLLVAAPGLDVLATSREPLRITGEHRLDVPPLAPDAAAELFVQRARAVRRDLVLEDADTRAIERICARLDGLPLALELAAARASVFSPRALEARLAEGLPLPAGPRDLPERQRTLQATIDWSYRLLDGPEQGLLVSLAPFVGGVRLETAESIWGTSVTDSLISLAEKSLLRRREDPDGEPRFWMLETVREFALGRGDDGEAAGAAADTHAEYFATLAEQAAPHLHGRGQLRWLDRVESDHANVRGALDHLSIREPARALSMASDLAWFWHTRGYQTEALRRLTEVLASAPRDSAGRGRALIGAGRIAASLGDLEEAKSLSLNALAVARRENEPRVAVLALANLGWTAAMMGDDAGTAAGYEEAIATARTAGDDWALGLALNGYSSCPAVRADAERARPMVEEALTLFRRSGDPAGTAVTAGTFAEIATDAGDLELAEPLVEESLALAREIEFRPAIAGGLVDRSVILLLRGDADGADRDIRAALETCSRDNVHVTAETLAAAATIAAIRREPERAAMLWAACDRTVAEAWAARSALARLREQWEPQALADAGAATWDVAWKAGTELAIDDALALAAGGPASIEPSAQVIA
jgi:predicted ATPase